MRRSDAGHGPVLPEQYALPYSALFYQNGTSCSTRTVRPASQRSVLPERYVLFYQYDTSCLTASVLPEWYVLPYSALFYQNGTSCLTALCSTRTVRPASQRSVLPERYVLPYSALFYQNGTSYLTTYCSTWTHLNSHFCFEKIDQNSSSYHATLCSTLTRF